MREHPLTISTVRKGIGGLSYLTAASTQCALLVSYSDYPIYTALTDSLLSVTLFAVAGYYLWYILTIMPVIQAWAVIAIATQLACIASSYLLLQTAELVDWAIFAPTIPFRFLFGSLAWVILSQWYIAQRSEYKTDTDTISPPQEQPADKQEPADTDTEVLDRISVKDGSRIHILPLDEIVYLQSSGDYVTLFATSGQFVKEQTMKYFEQHLPSPGFVRIHRSYIVNTGQILRVELFGKETYQVRLKNGAYLRASIAGYKLLKERLGF